MKKSTFIILIGLISFNLYAQEKKLSLSVYISPGICQLSTQHRLFKDGQVTLTNMNKSWGLFFGGGLELIRNLNKNWMLGGDLGFVSKGYFATRDTAYNNGSIGGTGFIRTDLNFLETKLFIGKQILLKNPEYRLIFSSGLFYGFHIPNIMGVGLEAKGNDFGGSILIGIQREKFFLKLDYKKGVMDIDNNANASFKTSILSFKIGCSIL